MSIDDKPTADSLGTGLCGIVSVYRRTSDTTYERTTYRIMGDKGRKFLDALSNVRASVLPAAAGGVVLALWRRWCLSALTLA